MTNSFKVKPQRQVRDQVAGPAKPKMLARPAAPLEIPQQLGGELIDRRDTQADPRISQALSAMETWSGVAGKSVRMLGEQKLQEKKAQAERLIEQETYAFEQTLKNSTEVEKLRKRKAFNEARYAQLRNPYINFFYYGTKADNAAKIVSTKLNKWGKDNADRLAREDDVAKRAAEIAGQTDDLMKPYSDIPQKFITAKIDPILAQSKQEIQNLISNAELKVAQEKIDKQIGEAFVGPLVLGAELGTVDGTTPLGSKFQEDSVKMAYQAGLEKWNLLGQPGGQRGYNEWLFNNVNSIFVDNNNNNYNDLAEGTGIDTILNGLKGIKTEDGHELLDTQFTGTDGKKLNIRQKIQQTLLNQAQLKNKIQKAAQDEITRSRNEFKNDQRSRLNTQIAEALSDDGILDSEEIEAIREEERERITALAKKGDGYLPWTLNGTFAELDKQLPTRQDKISTVTKAEWQKELDGYKYDPNRTELPEEFLDKIRNTEFYYTAVSQMSKAVRSRGGSGENTSVGKVVQHLDKELKDTFQQDKAIIGLDKKTPAREPTQEKGKEAYNRASPGFQAEAEKLATALYRKYKNDNPDLGEKELIDLVVNDPQMRSLFKRPEYSDIDYYYDVENQQYGTPGWGARVRPDAVVPPIQSEVVKTDASGAKLWNLKSDETDGGTSWRMRHREQFASDPEAALTYASENFLFDNRQFKEIMTIPALGDPRQISKETENAIRQRSYALGIPIPELLERQMKLFNSGNLSAIDKKWPDWREKLKLLESLRPPQAQTGTEPEDNGLYIFNDNKRTIDGDRGVIWESRKGNNVQTRTTIPTPIRGKVIFAGNNGIYGNQVVIVAERDHPEYHIKKGDQVVTSHLSKLQVKVGDVIGRGTSIGLAGDRSEANTSEGQSSTGNNMKSGQVMTQIYNSDGYQSKDNQYNQWKQKIFFKRAYTGLYSAN